MNKNNVIDSKKRKTLIALSVLAGGLGVGLGAVPFVASWLPSARAKAMGAAIDIDTSSIEEGQRLTLDWRGQPIFVIKRSKENLDALSKIGEKLRDPLSNEIQQPVYGRDVELPFHIGGIRNADFRPQIQTDGFVDERERS